MTKSELIDKITAHFRNLPAKDAEESVKLILEAISGAMANGKRIEIRGFGSFSIHTRPPRIGRNPMTGEKVEVPAKNVAHFKPGVEMKKRVDVG